MSEIKKTKYVLITLWVDDDYKPHDPVLDTYIFEDLEELNRFLFKEMCAHLAENGKSNDGKSTLPCDKYPEKINENGELLIDYDYDFMMELYKKYNEGICVDKIYEYKILEIE